MHIFFTELIKEICAYFYYSVLKLIFHDPSLFFSFPIALLPNLPRIQDGSASSLQHYILISRQFNQNSIDWSWIVRLYTTLMDCHCTLSRGKVRGSQVEVRGLGCLQGGVVKGEFPSAVVKCTVYIVLMVCHGVLTMSNIIVYIQGMSRSTPMRQILNSPLWNYLAFLLFLTTFFTYHFIAVILLLLFIIIMFSLS